MHVNKIDNSTNFGIKFDEGLKKLINEKSNSIIFRYSKNSSEYKEFQAIVKQLKKIKSGDTLDAYKCTYSPKIAVFELSGKNKTQKTARINNDKNLFKNILDFVMNM